MLLILVLQLARNSIDKSDEEIIWDLVCYGDVNLDGEVRITDVIEF